MEQSNLYKENGRKDRKQLPNFFNCEYKVINICTIKERVLISVIDNFLIYMPYIYWLPSFVSILEFSFISVIMIKYLQPLLHPNQHDGTTTKILIKAPPPPLHCVRLGPTNHLVRALRELWPELQVYL